VISITVSPTNVAVNGSAVLNWSASNATSCSASGGWSGPKTLSGSQSTGTLAASKTYNLSCTGTGGNVSKSVTVLVDNPPNGSLAIPSLDDERNAYRTWGWSWSPSVEPGAVTEPKAAYSVNAPDIHYGTEGDDLWTYLMMYRRTGNTVYLNRAQEWANYFKNNYRTSREFQETDDGFLLDHLYGWGLVAWYEYTCEQGSCDTAALAEAENIAAVSESHWSTRSKGGWPVPGQFSMAFYGQRQGARHLLLVTRVAEATGKQRWKDLRDRLIDLWAQSPDWDSRGMYFFGDFGTDNYMESGAYASGARMVSAFQIGILSEAFEHAYRTTGRAVLRDRMVAMARFVDQYGLDPGCQYAGSYFGFRDGKLWHSASDGNTSSCTASFFDAAYTTSLVNVLARGYKYTGDVSLYQRAKYFFNRGTKGIYGNPLTRRAPDNGVHHFIDTVFDSSSENFYLSFNKGELQYTYELFAVPPI
jgi:hypothetical protein